MPSLNRRVLVAAFEGWNDAGDAATGVVELLKESAAYTCVAQLDSELYVDYQFNRPVVSFDGDGVRHLTWPGTRLWAPGDDAVDGTAATAIHKETEVFLLLGVEPSRTWRGFAGEIADLVLAHSIDVVIVVGAMLADVPHTRPISVLTSSDDSDLRTELGLERSNYEGPVGIPSIIADAVERAGVPSVSLWASVPHYVHNAPSPKAVLALLEALENMLDITVDRGDLEEDALAWEAGIDALANEDDDMAAYISQLEQARDTVDSPDASGDAIAQEFEKYLRRRGDNPDDPWRGRGRPRD